MRIKDFSGINIEEETVEEMHTIQPPGEGYGLAWYYSGTLYGRIFSGHEGDIPGYHNLMFLQHPDKDIGVIYFVTGDRYNRRGAYMALFIRNLLFFKANTFDNIRVLDIIPNQQMKNTVEVPLVKKPLVPIVR